MRWWQKTSWTVGLVVLLAGSAYANAPVVVDVPEAAERLAQSGAPTVVLTSPGAEPRSPLRYNLAAVSATAFRTDMSMRINNPMLGAEQVLPTMRMNMSMTAPTALGDTVQTGFALNSIEVLETPGSPPEMLPLMRAALAEVGAFSGSMTLDARGALRDSSLNLDGLAPAARQQVESMATSMEQMTVPLPEEAVGVGATWNVAQTISQNGLTVMQNTTFTLVERTAQGARMNVAVTQTAAPQQLQDPSLPPGATVTAGLQSTGTGTMALRFDSLVPTSSLRLDMAMEMQMAMGAGATPIPMNMTMRMDVEIAPMP